MFFVRYFKKGQRVVQGNRLNLFSLYYVRRWLENFLSLQRLSKLWCTKINEKHPYKIGCFLRTSNDNEIINFNNIYKTNGKCLGFQKRSSISTTLSRIFQPNWNRLLVRPKMIAAMKHAWRWRPTWPLKSLVL